MINKNDKVLEVRLYSPHKCDFICEREDGTYYVFMRRGEDSCWELFKNKTGDGWIFGEKI
jgi:hypothetical protein